MRVRLHRLVVRAQPQIFRGQVRVHHLVRIHAVVRVPDGLELRERLHQLRPIHFGKQRAARLPVAVLAGKRAAVAHHQVRRALDELAIARESRLRSRDRT